ncbi:MAG: HlyC/CorC family transporter [Hyphomicrobium zavarzinii]|jgi:Mg2+/Co2+ transporter CorB|uniref:HlyC/CorC family transporter n=1 Tax=Hyphomicrobium TaxID=81 RepID=UPI00037D6535|nr:MULTISPECIES: HlyC/CorC family transporter [Hyphomicrobium]MBL8846334.1 HlyC/CorC family transporter [Hyphomicrobium zavarzinii]WBT38332.1 HlyC/CorC family transporter [Hyphomicrobium sp. DMF-1]HML41760.1 HlyC/CorC family transporter [Hyphomicrobium zavarzinii]
MTLEIGLLIGAIILLIAMSAFFNMSETGLTAASRARMHALDQEGNVKAKLVNRLLSEPEKMIGAVLLGNTLVDVLAAGLASTLAIRLVGEVGVVYATAIVTLLIVIFAAVLPKTYALAFSDRVALFVAPIMRVLIVVFGPATRFIELIVRWILAFTPTTKDDEANILAAHAEIRGAIDLQTKEGAVARHDAKMLGGVLDLRELQISDIMVHRTKMETFDANEAPQEIIDEVLRSQYTRVPIWKDEPENIVGILNTKDLLGALSRSNWDVSKLDIMSIAAKPWFVPDTTTLKDQLNQFLKNKAQMALVIDEYGEVQGLITLEDILEEIVGQITDEHDTTELHIRPQTDGTVNVDGTVPIRDLNRHMDWDLPDDEATTIAGLVVHEAQMIPEPGQVFTFYGYRMEILRRTRNKIAAVRIKRLDGKDAGTRPQISKRATH